MAKKLWENPQVREFHQEKAKKQWQDPIFREKIVKAIRIRNKKRMEEDIDFMRKLTKKAKISLQKKWQEPAYKEKVIKSKVLGYVFSLSKKHPQITPDIYEKERTNNGVPKLENALNYFDSFSEILTECQEYNHKVVKIKVLRKREDVYDLTIDPWHNFSLAAGVFVHNSIDDPSEFAAMRYTESRLSKIGQTMLADIDRRTVDYIPNYDGTRQEPVVLPSPLPNLLLNGTIGIAVGMATNIPPHNLSEICDAAIFLISRPKATTEELLEFIKGPDFPTGGIIYDKDSIIAAYSQGKGSILVRGRAEVVERKKSFQIIISEIPYGLRKSALVEQIAKLIQEKKLKGAKDIRDESDREGMRIVIDLKTTAQPKRVLNALYKYTPLQTFFHLNMVALVDGIQPKVLSLFEVLHYFLKHRQEVVIRRTKFDLKKAKERTHILEGLDKALKKIDAVIKTIKASKDKEEAEKNLVKKFKLTKIQANAILEMKLSALARLEREKIQNELKETKKLIKELSAILKSKEKIKAIMKGELEKIKKDFGDVRRTRVRARRMEEISSEDLVPRESTVITLTQDGFIKRLKPSVYRVQKRGGKGVLGQRTTGEDVVEHLIFCQTHDDLLFFTDSGKVFKTKAFEIAEAERTARGKSLLNFLELSSEEKVLEVSLLSKQDAETKYFVMATKDGIIKKTALAEFENVRRTGLIAIKLKRGDLLRKVRKTTGEDEIILVTKKGKSIRFKEGDVRPMGRTAAGVKGIRLIKGDEVIGMEIIQNKKLKIKNKRRKGEEYLLVVMENGYGKRTEVSEYRVQKRAGSGIKTAQLTKKTGELVASKILDGTEKYLISISQHGQVIKIPIASISKIGRATQGVRIMRLDESDKVASIACI